MHGLLNSYRKHEGDGNFRMSEEKIIRWIMQFEESDRVFVLTEMNNIFEKTYYSPERAAGLYILMLTKAGESLDYKELAEFLDNCVLMDCQASGKSQKAILSIVQIILNRKGYDTSRLGSVSKKHFIYMDDVLCTGKTFFDNVCDWLKLEVNGIKNYTRLVNGKITFHALYLGLSQTAFDRKVGQLYFTFSRSLKSFIKRRLNRFLDDNNLKPIQGLDDVITSYRNEVIKHADDYANEHNFSPYEHDFYRSKEEIETDLFTSEQSRERLENIFLKKGIEILQVVSVHKHNVRPLGYSQPSTKNYGFGALFFTWRNVPNNTPLVFWYRGGGFEPLFDNVR